MQELVKDLVALAVNKAMVILLVAILVIFLVNSLVVAVVVKLIQLHHARVVICNIQ